MNLTHKKADTWTAEDGTLFLEQRSAERYVAHRKLTVALMKRFAVVAPSDPMPYMTVEGMAELIVSMTFDEVPMAVSADELVLR